MPRQPFLPGKEVANRQRNPICCRCSNDDNYVRINRTTTIISCDPRVHPWISLPGRQLANLGSSQARQFEQRQQQQQQQQRRKQQNPLRTKAAYLICCCCDSGAMQQQQKKLNQRPITIGFVSLSFSLSLSLSSQPSFQPPPLRITYSRTSTSGRPNSMLRVQSTMKSNAFVVYSTPLFQFLYILFSENCAEKKKKTRHRQCCRYFVGNFMFLFASLKKNVPLSGCCMRRQQNPSPPYLATILTAVHRSASP